MKLITKDKLTEIRYQAWQFAGVEIELELVDANYELAYNNLDRNDKENANYERRRIDKLQMKLKLVNENLVMIERLAE